MPRTAAQPALRLTLVVLSAFAALSAFALPAAAQPGFSKSFDPATIGPGSASELTFTIDNTMGGPLTDLAFTDNLPAAVTLATPAGAENGCDGTLSAPDGGGTIALSGGTLAPGGTCTIRVNVTSSTPGTHMNVSGDLTSSAGNSGNATDDLTVATDRPGFSKSFSPATVQLGGRSTLTFTIDNSANGSTALNLAFSDTLPAGLEVAGPANGSTTCSGGAVTAPPGGDTISYASAVSGIAFVAAGATCTVSVDVIGVAVGTQDNRSGNLTSFSPFLRESGYAVASMQVDVDELALTKSFTNDAVPPGGTVNLRFSITNFNRSSSATGITFNDNLTATLSGLVAVAPLPSSPCGAGSTLSGTSTLTLTGGQLGPGDTCTFDVTLQVPAAATPGSYPNTTSTVTADVGGSPITGAAATESLFVQAVPLLTKTFLDTALNPATSIEAGDDVVIRFTVTNSSTTSAATDVSFSDNLSQFISGATVASLPPSGACGAGSTVSAGTITGETVLFLNGGNLPAGNSCSFDVTLQTEPGTSVGTYTNLTSDVSATVDGASVVGPPASADLFVLAGPDLIKSFQSSATAGGTVDLEFTLALSENSPTPATGITFTDDLDAALSGLTALSLPATGFCGPGSTLTGVSTLTLSGASLDPGESCTFVATLQVPAGALAGDYTNTTSDVTSTIDGTTLTSSGSTDDLRILGLVLSKAFLDDPAVVGGASTLQFTLDNTASILAASNISFSDDLRNMFTGADATGLPPDGFCGPSSQMVESPQGQIFITGASVAAGGACSFSVTVLVPAGTDPATYANSTSEVSAQVGGSAETIPRADAELTVIDPLSIAKSFTDDPVAPGETVTLEFTLSNASPTDTATGLTFTDDLDAALSGLATTAVPGTGFCGAGSTISGGGVITVSAANLGPASSCTFQVSVLVPAGASPGSTVVNTTSQLSGLVGGASATAAPASDELRIDLVELGKSFAGPSAAGNTVTLTFSIVNRSSAAVSGLGFTDDLEAALSGLVATGLPTQPCGAGSSITGTSLLAFSGGSLGAGESCSFDVTLQVPAGAAPGTYPNVTSALFSSGVPTGTAAAADLVIEPPPGFSKSFADTALTVGGTTTLTFQVDNGASVLPAENLAFTDDLPAGLEVAAAPNVVNGCGGTVTASAGATSISLAGGTAAAGGNCSLAVDVTATTAGTLNNLTGALTSSLGDSGTAGANLLSLAPAVTFEKDFLGTAIANGAVDLRFTITNGFTVPVNGVSFSDDLDAVIPGLVAEGLPVSDVCGAGSQVAGTSVITLTGGSLPAGGVCTFTVTLRLPGTVPGTASTNVTSVLSYEREGAPLEAAPATAELAPNALAIPTAQLWGLLLLTGLLGLLGWKRLG